MLRKEFNELLKQSLFFIVFVIGLPVLVLILSMLFKWSLTYNEIFFPVYQVGLFIFAVLTGVTLFSSEKRQGGIEYILTLPLSRIRLLWLKILPRLVVLSALLLLYLLYLYMVTDAGRSTDSLLVLPFFYLAYPVFWIFIISVSLSTSHDNIILLAIGIIVIFSIHSLYIPFLSKILTHFFDRILSLNEPVYAVLSTFGFLIPFAVPFVLAFRKFDLHPAGRFNRKYLKVFIPLLAAGLFFTAIFAYSISTSMYWHNLYYLTANHKVIEADLDSSRIYEKDNGKIVKLDISSFIWLLNPPEFEGYVYAETNSIRSRQFIRINVADNKVEKIYETKSYHSISDDRYWVFKNIFALFEGNFNSLDRTLVLVNIDTMAVSKIRLPAKLQEKYRTMRVFGVDENNGRRSWLVSGEKGLKFPVFRIWEDGNCQELSIRGHSPYYINGLLLSREDGGMVFSRLTATGCEEIKLDPNGKSVILYPFDRLDLNNTHWKEVYGMYSGKNGKSLMKVDIEKFEIIKLLDFKGTLIYYSPDQCYLVDDHLYPHQFFRILGDGHLKLLRTFPGFYTRKKGNFFQYSRNGIITRESGKISVYAYPDLQEMPFKGLN